MEALYNRAKLLQHGAQLPDTPRASARPFSISGKKPCSQQIDNSEQKNGGYNHRSGFYLKRRLENTVRELRWATAMLHKERLGTAQVWRTLSMCWQVHFTPRMLTTASRQSLGPYLRTPWRCSVYSAISQDPAILYSGLLYENKGITFNFINGGTLDERCCWKPATSVCCIHFSAGSTYSSCLMMLIRAASFTDKCVFGRIHHPEWVFLMSHPPACFTLSSIR